MSASPRNAPTGTQSSQRLPPARPWPLLTAGKVPATYSRASFRMRNRNPQHTPRGAA
jgi:hypothetical protein